ncbi:IgGFc-binding protein-like [Platysternon megacephalum]|uniref:IgGFc-binding protein-like n=1 Tax=Platysternon megacephalum TaxID=55544 RepID=A0A4D9DTB7_9SAUR|nr:IgGFc-binding protein-like [Platysternon megacephalum]
MPAGLKRVTLFAGVDEREVKFLAPSFQDRATSASHGAGWDRATKARSVFTSASFCFNETCRARFPTASPCAGRLHPMGALPLGQRAGTLPEKRAPVKQRRETGNRV